MHEEEPGGAFRVFDVLLRRIWWGAASFVIAFSAVVSMVAFLPDVYQSTSTVLIERQQIPDDLVRSTVTSALETRIDTISQEILSRSHLQELIGRFGLYEDLKGRMPAERIVAQMRDKVKIELKGEENRNDRATVAFTISFAGRDPRKVALVVNALATSYVQENVRMRERQAAGTADFLRQQLDDMRQRLEEQEKQVSIFKERHAGQLPQQLDANLKTLEQLNAQLRLNSDNQIQVTERRTTLVKQLSEAEGLATVGGPDAVSGRLLQLRQTLAALQTQYSDKYPEVVRVKSEINALEEQLRRSPDPGAEKAALGNPMVLQLKRSIDEQEVELKRLKAEEEGLRRSLGEYRQRVEVTPKREQEFQSLSRNYETTKELYRSLVLKQRESELAEEMEQRRQGEQFRVIDPALPATDPAAPRRGRILALGLALCLGLAGGVMFLRDFLDGSFHSVEELQGRSSLPVLVTIPRIVTAADKERQRRQAGLVAASVAAGVVLIVGGSYLVAKENLALTALLLK